MSIFNKSISKGNSIFSGAGNTNFINQDNIDKGAGVFYTNQNFQSGFQSFSQQQQNNKIKSGKEIFKQQPTITSNQPQFGNKPHSGANIFAKSTSGSSIGNLDSTMQIDDRKEFPSTTQNIFHQQPQGTTAGRINPLFTNIQGIQNLGNIQNFQEPQIFNTSNIFASKNEVKIEPLQSQEVIKSNNLMETEMEDFNMNTNKSEINDKNQMNLNIQKVDQIPKSQIELNLNNTKYPSAFPENIAKIQDDKNEINIKQNNIIKKEPTNLEEFEEIIRSQFEIPRII